MKFLLFFVLFGCAFSVPISSPKVPICGYESCNRGDPSKLTVHLVPHSHDDVGWLRTYQEYYDEIVDSIITTYVEALKKDPSRRFIQVETAFLWKWWNKADDAKKQDFIDLVNSGQLELINGGWAMNDEGAVYYQSTIDQMSLGLRTLNASLGACGRPKIGWQIDPFGHSREQALVFSKLGYDAFFLGRLDYRDKATRTTDLTREFIWSASDSLDEAKIFTSMFPDFYGYPGGFCGECDEDQIIDDPDSPNYNLDKKISDFKNKMLDYATRYRTKNILVPMGNDFQYEHAEKNFAFNDKLIKGVAQLASEDMVVIYSTPSCYLQAVNEAAVREDIELTVKTDDFFPYASDPHSFWSGYFSSRASFKRLERSTNNILQGVKQISGVVQGTYGTTNRTALDELKRAMGVIQHHDAITGTAKQYVNNDYETIVHDALLHAEQWLSEFVKSFYPEQLKDTENFKFCLLSNISVCEPSSTDNFVVATYNPLAKDVEHVFRIPVRDGDFKIIDNVGKEVEYDLVDSVGFNFVDTKITGEVLPKELVFQYKVTALGGHFFYVKRKEKTPKHQHSRKLLEQTTFGTETLGFELDKTTNRLKSITMNGVTQELRQDLMYYEGAAGDNSKAENRASGAYIFRPSAENYAYPILDADTPVPTEVTIGTIVDEVKQKFSDWATQVIRVYKNVPGKEFVEIDWIVGPIPVDEENKIGKEVISRITLKDFNNENTFYTDSNGRQLVQRITNKRNGFKINENEEPVANNYNPVNAKIVIKDEEKKVQFAVLTDRSEAGGSLENGEIELLIHRRLLCDDAFGVGEALNETEFEHGLAVRGSHFLVLHPITDERGDQAAIAERKLQLVINLQPLVLVAESSEITDFGVPSRQELGNIPEFVNLLTWEPLENGQHLIRLEYYLDANEAPSTDLPLTDLSKLLKYFDITSAVETNLGANDLLSDLEARPKFEWKTTEGIVGNVRNIKPLDVGDWMKSLRPMEIRTFIVTLEPKTQL